MADARRPSDLCGTSSRVSLFQCIPRGSAMQPADGSASCTPHINRFSQETIKESTMWRCNAHSSSRAIMTMILSLHTALELVYQCAEPSPFPSRKTDSSRSLTIHQPSNVALTGGTLHCSIGKSQNPLPADLTSDPSCIWGLGSLHMSTSGITEFYALGI